MMWTNMERPYFVRWHKLTVEGNCMLWMRGNTHIQLAPPNIEINFVEIVSCQDSHDKPVMSLLHPWSWVNCPWKRVHIGFWDLSFVIVDVWTNHWMSTTILVRNHWSTENIIFVMPEQLVSEFGPPNEYAEFIIIGPVSLQS